MMSDLRFRKRLDSELKNIVFTAQSRQKVLEITRSLQEDRSHKLVKGLQEDRSHKLVKGLQEDHEREHRQIFSAWLEKVNKLLETELRIPVKPLVIALLITLSGLVYGCIGTAGVSAEEIQKSSITVMDGNDGGQANELYKD